MERVILKYEITEPEQTIEMPRGARLVHLGVQHDLPVMWWSVPSQWEQMATEQRRIVSVGTGRTYRDEDFHVGTVQIGPMVWHIFTQSVFLRESTP
jgi:hypothetical protein